MYINYNISPNKHALLLVLAVLQQPAEGARLLMENHFRTLPRGIVQGPAVNHRGQWSSQQTWCLKCCFGGFMK